MFSVHSTWQQCVVFQSVIAVVVYAGNDVSRYMNVSTSDSFCNMSRGERGFKCYWNWTLDIHLLTCNMNCILSVFVYNCLHVWFFHGENKSFLVLQNPFHIPPPTWHEIFTVFLMFWYMKCLHIWFFREHVEGLTKCFLTPKGSKCFLTPKGSKCFLTPKGSKCFLTPKGSKCFLTPKGS